MSIPKEDGIIPIGTEVLFKGYTELEEGQMEILKKNQRVRVTGYSAETENYLVEAVDNDEAVDNVFEEELKAAPQQKAAEEKAPAKSRRTRKTTAKAKAEAEPEVEAAPKKTTTRKTKAKTPATKAKAPAKAQTAPKAKTETKAGGIVVMSAIKDFVGDHETAITAASELAEAITERTEQLEQSKFALGGVLCYIKAENIFEEEGFESIEAFCTEKLGLKDRSCQTYMQVYTSLTEAGVTEKEIEGIGISKLRTVAGVIEKGNKRNLLAMAKKKSRDDLVDHVKEIRKGKTSANDPNAAQFEKLPAMKFFADQAEVVKSGLAEAMKSFNTDSQAEALYHIVTEWMQAQEGEVAVEDALDTFNTRYGTDFALEE